MKKRTLGGSLFLAFFSLPGIAMAVCTGQPINFDEPRTAVMAADGCIHQSDGAGYHFDSYQFSGAAGDQIAATLFSATGESFLQLIFPDNTFVNDDADRGGLKSRIPADGFLTLTQTGTHSIAVLSAVPLPAGAYTLTVSKAAAASPTVVEYFNPDLKNYFITADPGEQTFVDSGAVGRWQRTGNTFTAGGPNQVCRFYGSPLGPNSHFYTADAGECAFLKSIYDPAAKSWKFESNDFSTTAAVNKACAGGLVPIYRAYNNGFAQGLDSNHRITSNLTAYQQTVSAGWVGEGIVMCAPPGGTSSTCTYSLLASSSPTIGGNGGTGSVNVNASTGCGWAVTGNSTSWITVIAGAKGIGNGTVSFSVAANSTTSTRTGTLTIAGRSFVVAQAGANPPGVWSGSNIQFFVSPDGTQITPTGSPIRATGTTQPFALVLGPIPFTCSIGSGSTTIYLVGPFPINNGQFSISNSDFNGDFLEITGRFTSSTTANGTYRGRDTKQPGCTIEGSGTWTASTTGSSASAAGASGAAAPFLVKSLLDAKTGSPVGEIRYQN